MDSGRSVLSICLFQAIIVFLFVSNFLMVHGLKEEKLTKFHFYFHDIISGGNQTAVEVVKPVKNSISGFGSMRVIDDPLTIGPEKSSKLIGRAQGFYLSASQEELALLMTMNFVFIDGEYNGSTITILGRNMPFTKVREMPVIGGTGVFRYARGYVKARTYSIDMVTAVVKYNVNVLHY